MHRGHLVAWMGIWMSAGCWCMVGDQIRAEEPAAVADAEADSAAELILRLLEEPGGSVLSGTEFAPADEAPPREADATPGLTSEGIRRRMLTGQIQQWAAEARRRPRRAGMSPVDAPLPCTAEEEATPSAFDSIEEIGSETAHPSGPVQVLRRAARRLDRLAAELEDACLYVEADELRGHAQELRERGRIQMEGRSAAR